MHRLESKSDIIRGFSPAWFNVTMGTGSIAVLTYNFPYHWAPLEYIGMAIALFNVIVYVAFSILFLARLIRYRDFYDILLHPQLSMSLGTIPMGLCTIVNALVTMLTRYNTHWIPTFALVLWCIIVVISVLCSLAVPFVAMTYQKYTIESMSSILLLPVVPNVVAVSTGGIVASVHSGSVATTIILISYVLWGMGVGLAMMLITAYLIRLVLYKLPPKEAMASAFIPLGPLGQSSYGIQVLGIQALRVLPKSLPQIAYLGDILHVFGFILGLLLWALALWWFVHAIYSSTHTFVHGKVPFNLGWWALIFPVGTLIYSSNALANTTGFTFFRVITAVLTAGLALLWIFVLARTFRFAWTGELFMASAVVRLELADNATDNDDEETNNNQNSASETCTGSPVSGIINVSVDPLRQV
ncbi:Plasma membrane sulfite pump involved in sulfite metabolism [Coemansia sp. RSA 2703]|nr:Plasma membrane sulfite pump involved in sulfite metabolism [Coemansia sp. RSA 2703]KAJ2378210.1 Plasma membrane sulfite pump involved in sulfite metabolism [Coemansia sp. RSA 2607]KAJ2398148.1 Plasma membrane sulfite pump involved in sulfite metabolism [Coemansia sp. RSA 2603]